MCKKALIITYGDIDNLHDVIPEYVSNNMHVTLCFKNNDKNKYTFEQFKYYIQSVYGEFMRNNMLSIMEIDFLGMNNT
jgi:hypothetical protein